MEFDKPSFEKDLWGQCGILHERLSKKIDYYKAVCKTFKPINSLFNDLNEKIKAMKLTMDPTIPVELYTDSKTERASSLDTNSKWYSIPLTMNKIKEYIFTSTDFTYQSLFNTFTNLQKLITKMREEKSEYEDYQKSLSLLADSKKSMEKKMKEYHLKMYAAEQSVLDWKKIEVKNMAINDATLIQESKNTSEEKAIQLTNDSIKPFKIYQDSVDKANEMREQSIDKQKNLLYIYQEIEEEVGRVNHTITNILYSVLKFQKDTIEKLLIEIDNIRNSINTTKDIKQLILNYTGNEKPEGKILFNNFKTTIDFDKSENLETYKIFTETVKFIKGVVNDEYPLYDEKLEKDKSEMRGIMNRLFENNDMKDQDKLLNYMKNKKMHNSFLIVLSKLRTNNRFQQTAQIIELLGTILNDILKVAEKDKLYENAKNCIILSQTFFYVENNEKHYLLEKILKNKWLTSVDFWTNFIDLMIEQEIDKFILAHPEIKKSQILSGSDEINDKFRMKISELLFSQLLPYINNMNEFKVDMKNIVKVTEYFCDKYNFLTEEHQESIYGLLCEDKAKIEKYRKEYKKENNKKEKKNELPKKENTNIMKTPDDITPVTEKKTNNSNKNLNVNTPKPPDIKSINNAIEKKASNEKNLNISIYQNKNMNNNNSNNNNINKNNNVNINIYNKNNNNNTNNTNSNKNNNIPNNSNNTNKNNNNTNVNKSIINKKNSLNNNTNKNNAHENHNFPHIMMQNELKQRVNTFHINKNTNNKFINNEINNNSSFNTQKSKDNEKKSNKFKNEDKKETKKEEHEKKKVITDTNKNNNNSEIFGVTLKKIKK